MFILEILSAWLLADFISGLVHWYEDQALTTASRFEFINSIRRDNERHHEQPGYFLRLTWWQNINTTAPFAWAIALGLWALGAPLVAVLVAAFLGIGNLVHRWAHENPRRLPRIVRGFQSVGLFATSRQHSTHHFKNGKPVSRHDSDRCYCVMSDWLNPLLDRIKFFDFINLLVR